MSPRTGRPTDNPKDIRLEVRITDEISNMLDVCAEMYNTSKASIIRSGIKKMYERGKIEMEMQKTFRTSREMVNAAEKIRGDKVMEDAYGQAYSEAYAIKYSQLILDTDYTPSDAKANAHEYACEVANEAAQEAVNDFWET